MNDYGKTADIMDGKPIPEGASLDPVSPYGVSKLTTEKMGNQYYMSFDVQVITARFFIQVGVGGTDSLAIHQFCKQIALAEAGFAEPVVRHGNLNTARDMTDCRDSAPVVVSLAEKGKPGEAYNIGSGMAMTIQELLLLHSRKFQSTPWLTLPDSGYMMKRRCCQIITKFELDRLGAQHGYAGNCLFHSAVLASTRSFSLYSYCSQYL